MSQKEFTDELPTFQEGRGLLDGRRLDANGAVIENLSAEEIALYANAPNISASVETESASVEDQS